MFYTHCSPKTANRFANDFLKNFFPEENLSDYFKGNLPATNISETEASFVIELAVPSLQKEDFEILVENNVLTVKAEKKHAEGESKPHYTRQEFDFSTFKRSFRVGKAVDTDRIEARYENGVLRLELPKKEQHQEKTAKNIHIS